MMKQKGLSQLIRREFNVKAELELHLHEPFVNKDQVREQFEQCINSGWFSSNGSKVSEFEHLVKNYTKAKGAVAVNCGTNALRMALHVSGVRMNEEVMMPSLTFVGTANAVSHLGAVPYFIDVEEHTLGICPIKLRKELEGNTFQKGRKRINKKTGRIIKGIIGVHILGYPCQILEIKKVADEFELKLIEDAAESLGSWINKEKEAFHTGLIGDVGILSFNGNKVITSGCGGMILTNCKTIEENARHLSTTAKVNDSCYLSHDQIAWNDRMSNINAALAIPQVQVLEKTLEIKQRIHQKYKQVFAASNMFSLHSPWPEDMNNNWINAIRIKENNVERYIEELSREKIYCRPLWNPLHTLPMYNHCPKGNLEKTFNIQNKYLCLPSGPSLIK